MKNLNKTTGFLAEDMAANALIKKGYDILERNFSNRFGEIDIIARDKETTVFVEVKAKTGDFLGTPEEMINPNKLSKIRRMASIYINDSKVLCRIDVIAIVLSKDSQLLRLTHYENVY